MNFFYLQIGYKTEYLECVSPEEQEFCSPAYSNLKLMKICNAVAINKLPHILEPNLHPFYSFRGLKSQMRIRIAYGLDSRSWAGFLEEW